MKYLDDSMKNSSFPLKTNYLCSQIQRKVMKRPTLPHDNLDLLKRLYKWGIIWLVLFLVFFTVHSNGNMLFRLVSSLCFVGMVAMFVTFINKVLIEYLLKPNKVVLFILLSILVVPIWATASTALDSVFLHLIQKRSFSEIVGYPVFMSYMVRLIWFIAIFAMILKSPFFTALM